MLPSTPSTADSAATASKTACPVRSDGANSGNSASGSITWRDAATSATAARRRPKSAVLQAAGSWNSCAICGSATTRPVSKALACRWMAHPVRIAPPAQAVTTSATSPSAVHAPSERRSREREVARASAASTLGAPASAPSAAGAVPPARDGAMLAASAASGDNNESTIL